MPDDAQTPNTPLSGTSRYPTAPDSLQNPAPPLPPGLSPVPEPAPIQSGPASSSPGGPAVPAVPTTTPSPSPQPQVPPPSVDLSAVASAKKEASAKGEASAKADPSALAGLATSLNEIPSTPVIPPADTIPASQGIPVEPEQKKKSGGKTSAIIGGLFLLIVLPVSAYFVVQKTDIMSNLPFAWDYQGTQGTTTGVCGGSARCENSRNTQEGRQAAVRPAAVAVVPPAAATATSTPTSTPTETPTSTPTETPTSTPVPTSPPSAPGVCDASCGVDSNCSSGFVCATVQGIKRCRKPECIDQFTCVCPAATATPIPPVVQQVRQIVVTATPSPIAALPTPKVPVSGVPSVLGASTIVGGILLLLLGLLL